MARGVGLDFGTSNSAMGYTCYSDEDGDIVLTTFDGRPYLPSAAFFDEDNRSIAFGQDALSRYLDGSEGRMIWSPKNALGTPLMSEKTAVFDNTMVSFPDIIARVIEHITRVCTRERGGLAIEHVVCGRPVRFHDTDDALDAQAEQVLRDVLTQVGFEHIEFEFEPIGASVAYAQDLTSEQIALVVDMGGGTSDFTVVRLTPGSLRGEVLSIGGVHIAGTTFDMRLSLKSLMPELGLGTQYRSMLGKVIPVPTRVFHQLSTWHKINFAYTPDNMRAVDDVHFGALDKDKVSRLVDVLDARYGHALAKLVEAAKIDMSTNANTHLVTDGLTDDFEVAMTREGFEAAIAEETGRIGRAMRETIQDSGLAPANIDVVFLTGGTSRVPVVRRDIERALPNARLLDGDTFGSVASGLALLARHHFG